MYVKVRRRHHASQSYEYIDIVESYKQDGKVCRHTLGSLGRRDLLAPEKVDSLIQHLRKLASPTTGSGVSLDQVRMESVRDYGVALAADHIWRQLGLDQLLRQLPHPPSVPLEEAVFRMVVNRLSEPGSELSLVDWTDGQGVLHRGWQGRVQWPSGRGDFAYQHYLRAMDSLHPHRQWLEDQLFPRVRELFSLPLRLVLYDLTSSYFEGDGVCQLAAFGYSRDHRQDRAQVAVGLAVTQEGFPITHRVFKGDTVDVTTLLPIVAELRSRFGLAGAAAPVVVADRGMFSEDNAEQLRSDQVRYVMALRSRTQADAELAVGAALEAGLERPQELSSPRQVQEVAVVEGLRHVVVYSALQRLHDHEVREARLAAAREELTAYQRLVRQRDLSQRKIVERVTRILGQHKCARYFSYEAERGQLHFRTESGQLQRQRQGDGMLVLETNCQDLSQEEVVASYLQLQEVERSFRVLKSLIRVRPLYHHQQRRVESHIFICFLAYLLTQVLKQRLVEAGRPTAPALALDQLRRLQAVEHSWEGDARVVQVTRPDPDTAQVLDALGVQLPSTPVLQVRPAAA